MVYTFHLSLSLSPSFSFLSLSLSPSSPLTEASRNQDSFHDHDDQVMEVMKPGVDPEADSNHYMAILVESLSTLGRVKDALDVCMCVY